MIRIPLLFGFSGLADPWGCLMFPKGGTGNYVNIPNDNIIMIPSCYDAQTADNLMFIYEMWVTDTPGYGGDDSWADRLLDLTDERAVYDTYGTLRDSETQVANKVTLLGDTNSVLGPDLLWGISTENVDEVTSECAEKWVPLCNEINQAYGTFVLKDENGNILEDGASLTGQFYYKIYAEVPEGCDGLFFGWAENMEATEPDAWENERRPLSRDDGGAYVVIVPVISGEYTQEVMFAAMAPDGEVRRIALYYDRDASDGTTTAITSEAPELYTPYALRWEAVDGAALYYVRRFLESI